MAIKAVVAVVCFTALACVVAEQGRLAHHSPVNASAVGNFESSKQQSTPNTPEPGFTGALYKTITHNGTHNSQSQDEHSVLPHNLQIIHITNATTEWPESFQKQNEFHLALSDFTNSPNVNDKANQMVLTPGETTSRVVEGLQKPAIEVTDTEATLPKPAQVFGEPTTTTFVSIELPRQQQRVIEQRMTKPEIDNQRIVTQETQELKIFSGQFKNISSVSRKGVFQEIPKKSEVADPIEYHHLQQADHNAHHTPRQQTLQPTERTTSPPSRSPVFDFAKFPRLDHPKTQRLQITRLSNRNISLPLTQSDESSPQIKNRSSFSRTSQPITFHLKGRSRSQIQHPQRNRSTHNQRVPFRGITRSRPFVHYARPSHLQQDQNTTDSGTSGSILSLEHRSRLNDSDEWVPKQRTDQVSTLKTLQLESPSATETQFSTNNPNQSTGSNITVSLEHARELFTRAQERYKNLSAEEPQVKKVNDSVNDLEYTATDPDQQYSSSYSQIRHSDGSVYSEDTGSSSTATSVTDDSSPSVTEIPIASSTEHQTTIHTATLNPLIVSSELSQAQSTQDFDNTPAKSNISLIDNESTLPEKYDYTADFKSDVSTADPSDVLLKKDADTTKYNSSASDTDNTGVIPITKQDDITKAEPIQLHADSGSILSKTALSVPVSGTTPFQSSLFPSLQNFNLFRNGNSNHQQQNAFHHPPSLATANTGTQTPSLSNLFGLGSLLSTGGLSSNLGNLGSISLGQSFSNLNTNGNQPSQQTGTGVGGSGYLSLLSGLGGLGLGQLGGSSSPELSLPSLSQDSSSQQPNTGLGLLPGLSSLNLGGLGNFGSLGSLGNPGSIPDLSSIGNIMGTSGNPLDSLAGLGGFGLTRGGINRFSAGASESSLKTPAAGSSIIPIFGKSSIPGGLSSVINQPASLLGDTPNVVPKGSDVASEPIAAAGPPPVLSSVDASVPASSPSIGTITK
ncbi:uncharacterized protein [Macrobrachium rosenbergii]|uniref:uncharacterized protein n=1 Tax=Macrobrachium rosenbergii TaxID=79674 RepID=UPI0034D62675